jgi:hypothetical protein
MAKIGRFTLKDCDRIANQYAGLLASYYAESRQDNDNDGDLVVYVLADDADGWRTRKRVPDRVGDVTVEKLAAGAERGGPDGISFLPVWLPRKKLLAMPEECEITELFEYMAEPAADNLFYVIVRMERPGRDQGGASPGASS